MKLKNSALQNGAISMTTLLMGALIGLISWAALFEIDQSVRVQGQLIPGARTQIIQAADGGVLSRILVQEGQSVTAGQPLAELERDRSNASYDESRAKEASLSIALIRAQAEANNSPLNFGAKFSQYPEFISTQQALYMQRKRSMKEDLATLNDSLVMAQEELAMSENLLKTGDGSRLEVMRASRQLGEINGRINSTRNKYLQEAHTDATKISEELSSSRYKVQERQSVLSHTVLNAPVTGVVKYLKVTTIGGVLRAGDELMQISPTDGDMVVEAKINPVDIGQLKIGLPVSIKLDAYDYSVYGSLSGTLTYISSDTLVEQGSNGQTSTYYRAQVHLDPKSEKINPKMTGVVLKPGMTSTIDIRTNSRSVLKYLAKPIFKAFGGALNER